MDAEPWPVLGQQAVRDGALTAHRLATDYRSLHRNVYLPRGAAVTALTRARAAWLWSGGAATLTGFSAAAVHGTKWLPADRPAELCRTNRHHPAGIRVHSYTLPASETCAVDRMRVTTASRTAFDLGRTLPLDVALVVLDALANATGLKFDDVVALADLKPGFRGVRRLRAALALSDGGAESPQETRLRLLLVRAGLPRPETQVCFADQLGRTRVRVDLGWRRWKVAVEYDGSQHWTDRRQRSWDIDRLALLEEWGWSVVRVSAELMSRPRVVIDRVTQKLRAAGCPL